MEIKSPPGVYTLPDSSAIEARQRRFAEDEAILARFGKQQQLRVGAPIITTPMLPPLHF